MSAAARPVFELRGATVGARAAALTLAPGELLLLRAPTGARMREVAELCCGLRFEPELEAAMLGQEWQALDEAQRRLLRARLAVVPADGGWAPHLPVAESMLMAALAHRLDTAAALRERAAALCRRFGLPGLPLDRPRELREGDLARAACARAFLSRPALLILEDPVHGEATEALRAPLLELLAESTATACLWLTTSRTLWHDAAIPAAQRHRLAGGGLAPLPGRAA